MSAPDYFVIFGAMRTGSNLLEKTLEALGDTVCYGEAFNPHFIGGPRKTELLGWTRSDRDADPFGFLQAMLGARPDRIPGFRIFDGHDAQVTAHALADPACARIVLRRDPLETYISLKIARATDQWLLRNPRRRRTAMVRFDGPEFGRYREALARHYAWLDAGMAQAGTSALRIEYGQLSDRATLAAAARHIGSAGRVPEGAPILRQNPGTLAEKVTNHREMCDWLGRCPEPPPRRPEARDLLLAPGVPLAFAPLAGPGTAFALALMQKVGANACGARAVAPTRLLAEPAAHFVTGLERDALARELAGRQVFTVVCHPAVRLHGLFLDAVFGAGWHGSPVRRLLVARLGDLPSEREARRDGASFPAELHRAVFAAYLDLVDEAADGTGATGMRPEWQPQADLLDAYETFVHLDTVGHLDAPEPLVRAVCSACAQPMLRPGQVKGLTKAGIPDHAPLSRILDAELAERIRRLHRRDFTAFGYGLFPAG